MPDAMNAEQDAIGEAFDELEAAVAHLDALDECTPLFGQVKQELEAGSGLPEKQREAFTDHLIDLYVRARRGRENAEQAENRAEADAYHRDTAALLNAVSMLCFVEPEADRDTLMARLEAAYAERA